jgi:hypothetical protein
MGKRQIHNDSRRASRLDTLRESDRGSVILMGAILDEALRRLHHANLSLLMAKGNVDTIAEMVFDTKWSDFHCKIEAAKKFELISETHYKALEIVRKLRNEAAHFEFKFTFEDEGVRKQLFELMDLVCPELRDVKAGKGKGSFIVLADMLATILKRDATNLVEQTSKLGPSHL